ncbi:hypothetical protein [Acinetobacter sp. A47]|uniref:hypothetical protein n=1 Tax=Acinetobacter sp. A47 TaxID=1561217 RepID=UPI00056DB123|nr:hypothetical protein [Acinetobacter sp. A47]
MSKYMLLEQHISRLGIGEFLFIGQGYELNEMQNVLYYLKTLETRKILQIVYQHVEQETGQGLVDLVKVQKC